MTGLGSWLVLDLIQLLIVFLSHFTKKNPFLHICAEMASAYENLFNYKPNIDNAPEGLNQVRFLPKRFLPKRLKTFAKLTFP